MGLGRTETSINMKDFTQIHENRCVQSLRALLLPNKFTMNREPVFPFLLYGHLTSNPRSMPDCSQDPTPSVLAVTTPTGHPGRGTSTTHIHSARISNVKPQRWHIYCQRHFPARLKAAALGFQQAIIKMICNSLFCWYGAASLLSSLSQLKTTDVVVISSLKN